MPHANFVPLRVFSGFTMLEGAIEPKILAKEAKRLGFPAIAICDRNGLYGVMEFSDACKSCGVCSQSSARLLCGFSGPDRPDAVAPAYDWVPLYAQDEAGYPTSVQAVSAAHLDRPIDEPAHVTFEQLEAHTEGLIALTGGAEGAMCALIAEGQDYAAIWLC
jgi:DNA polymerase-3 subunit alpha